MRHFFSHALSICLMSASLLMSCVSEDTFDDTPEGNFEALWQIIDQHYCFLDYKAEAIGLDWAEVHQRYRQRISPEMTKVQLQEVLTDMLAELRDGHVNLYTSADISRYWHWYEDFPRNLDEELRRQYLGTDYKIAAGIIFPVDEVGILSLPQFVEMLHVVFRNRVLGYDFLHVAMQPHAGGIFVKRCRCKVENVDFARAVIF